MRVTRTDWLDWYVDDDESAVFVGGTVTVLSDLATVLLGLVGDGSSISELAAGLDAHFGSPPDVDVLTATEERVREMVGAGVLALE